MLVTRAVVSSLVTVALGCTLAFCPTALAQEPEVQIAELLCNGDPEIVLIKNVGNTSEPLTGWKLESDPIGSEVYDLTVLGGLAPGAAVSIQGGPAAGGLFTWGTEFVFRDNDPTDFARIVDDTGNVVDQVNCASEAAPPASPTASPQASPTPTPSPDNVPNGGGPPPPPSDALSTVVMIVAGGTLAAAGAVTVAVTRLRRRS
jgi:hypothetical protein